MEQLRGRARGLMLTESVCQAWYVPPVVSFNPCNTVITGAILYREGNRGTKIE